MILNDLIELLPKYKIKKITKDDYNDIYNLELSNIDFYMCTQGHAITYEEAIQDTIELPPNTLAEQKYYIGFYDNDKLIAVMDYIEHYPSNGIVWIGFFMIDNSVKRKKLGTKIITEFIKSLKKNDISKLQLGCFETNVVGLGFWHSFNMHELRRVTSKRDDSIENVIIVLEKDLI